MPLPGEESESVDAATEGEGKAVERGGEGEEREQKGTVEERELPEAAVRGGGDLDDRPLQPLHSISQRI